MLYQSASAGEGDHSGWSSGAEDSCRHAARYHAAHGKARRASLGCQQPSPRQPQCKQGGDAGGGGHVGLCLGLDGNCGHASVVTCSTSWHMLLDTKPYCDLIEVREQSYVAWGVMLLMGNQSRMRSTSSSAECGVPNVFVVHCCCPAGACACQHPQADEWR
jgi:hypothetical protein